MHIRQATDQDRVAWNELVTASPSNSFLQTWQWGEVQRFLKIKFWRLILEDEGKIKSVALVIRRDLPLGRSWLYVPRGPIFSPGSINIREWEAWQPYWQQLAGEESALFVRIDPALPVIDLPAGWQKAEREVQPRHSLILDLTPSQEELLAGLKSKTRYNIRLAERKGVKVRFSQSPADVEAFIALSRSVTERSRFRYHPPQYYRAILGQLGSDNMAEIAIAEHAGDVLAAHIMIYNEAVATYAHGASTPQKKELMAPTYLYWQTIKRARERGCRTYDFFGVAPADAGSDHPWSGISRLKLSFGGQRQDYVGAYDFVVDSAFYQLFNIARRAKGLFH